MAKTKSVYTQGIDNSSMEELKEWLKPTSDNGRLVGYSSMEELKEWLKRLGLFLRLFVILAWKSLKSG